MHPVTRGLIPTFLLGALCSAPAFADGWTFTGLGGLFSNGATATSAQAVSADGSVIVGYDIVFNVSVDGFRYSNGAVTVLGMGEAYGVSANGSVIAGFASNAYQAASYTNGVVTNFGALPGGGSSSGARGVSADGTVIVGYTLSANGHEAFRYSNGVMTGLGDLPGNSFFSEATAASANGSVIVGWSVSANGYEAFRYTNGAMSGLGDLPGGEFYSLAHAISPDGAVIVGASASAGGLEAFRYANGVMTGLGDLPGSLFDSEATGVSADGSVVVGRSLSANGHEAFVWDSVTGMRSVRNLLIASGADMAGWDLYTATAISADGRTVVGFGTHNGVTEAWFAKAIPEPAAYAALLGWGCLAGAVAARRRRAN